MILYLSTNIRGIVDATVNHDTEFGAGKGLKSPLMKLVMTQEMVADETLQAPDGQ